MDTPVVDRKIDPQIVAAWIAVGTSKDAHTKACRFSRDGQPKRIEASGISVEFTGAE